MRFFPGEEPVSGRSLPEEPALPRNISLAGKAGERGLFVLGFQHHRSCKIQARRHGCTTRKSINNQVGPKGLQSLPESGLATRLSSQGLGLFFRPAGNAYPAAQLLGRDDGGTGRTARSHHQGIGHRQATFFDSQDNAVYIRIVAVQLIGLFDHQIDGSAAAGFFR